MKGRLMAFRCLLAVAALAFAISAQAAEQARIPYSLVCQIEKSQARVSQTYTNLHIVLRMRPLLPEVKTEDLRVFIDARGGPIGVKVDADGNFNVPISDTLLAENPWIVVNQPKGTMKLEWNINVQGAKPANGMHYRDLMRPLQQVQEIQRDIAREGSNLAIQGLKLVFSKDKAANVVVHLKQGDKVFKTDSDHALIIPLDSTWLDEDPIIGMSEEPQRMEVATRVKNE
jgi:hypothetical protein